MSATAQDYLLEFEEEGHRYFINGEETISITQVLQAVGAINTDYFTEEHRRRGSLVHMITESWDKKQPLDYAGLYTNNEIDVAAPFVAQWVKCRENVPFKIELGGIEEKIFDPVHCYAGRLDRRIVVNDSCASKALIELKTNVSGYIPRWTGLQLAAQAHAKEPNEMYRRFAVVLTPTKYIWHEFPTTEFVDDRDSFLCMVRTARWLRDHEW